jgi:hypothetical protein
MRDAGMNVLVAFLERFSVLGVITESENSRALRLGPLFFLFSFWQWVSSAFAAGAFCFRRL